MKRRFWTKRDIAVLRRDYPNKDTKLLAARLKRTVIGCYQQAQLAGIRKSAAYIERKKAKERETLRKSGAAHRFHKGHVPANAGLRRPGYSPGRMRETQFKKGQRSGIAAAHWVPVGSLRVNADGYFDRKVRDDVLPQKRWACVHRLIWIEAHGPIPPGHAVTFRPGRRTTVLDKITLDALEIVSRQDLMRRNSYHTNYPKEIGELIQLRGAVQRQINRRARLEKQN